MTQGFGGLGKEKPKTSVYLLNRINGDENAGVRMTRQKIKKNPNEPLNKLLPVRKKRRKNKADWWTSAVRRLQETEAGVNQGNLGGGTRRIETLQ